jgi:hypothetical protein
MLNKHMKIISLSAESLLEKNNICQWMKFERLKELVSSNSSEMTSKYEQEQEPPMLFNCKVISGQGRHFQELFHSKYLLLFGTQA